jgi:serine/threonine protein kinase
MIDFGMSSSFQDQKGKHISPRYFGKTEPSGSPRFMSIRTHLKQQRSRRDDLESLGYLLIYFAKGTLPWLGKTRDEISSLKEQMNTEILCRDLPGKFKYMIDLFQSPNND